MKDLLLDMQDQEEGRILAEELGISYGDLNKLEYRISTEMGDDGFLFAYVVEFLPSSPREIVRKIKGIESDKFVYLAPWQLDREYDYAAQLDAITQRKSQLKKFTEELEDIKKLNNITFQDEKLNPIFKRQIFISVIGLMETFLSDSFINLTMGDRRFLRNFIETHPKFKEQKFELRSIFEEHEKLDESAKRIMMDTIYHNLPSVRKMYMDTFKIEFPQINDVYPFVIERHDLVHRNGRTKDGKSVITDSTKVALLIEVVDAFVKAVAQTLKMKP